MPGECLVGAWPALAAAALAFNVYYLRIRSPGVVSGKLSDLAINFLVPLVLVAAMEWGGATVAALTGRRFRPLGTRAQVTACVLSAAYFALLQVLPSFIQVHGSLLGALDLPFGGERSFTRNLPDAADLLTLVTTVLAAVYLATRDALPAPAARPSP